MCRLCMSYQIGHDSRLHGMETEDDQDGNGQNDIKMLRFVAETMRVYGNLLAQNDIVSVQDVARYHAASERMTQIAAELTTLRRERDYLRHMIQRAHSALDYKQMSIILERALSGEVTG